MSVLLYSKTPQVQTWMERNVYFTPCDYFLDILTFWCFCFFCPLTSHVGQLTWQCCLCWLDSCFDFYWNKSILPSNYCSVVLQLVTPFVLLLLIRERGSNVTTNGKHRFAFTLSEFHSEDLRVSDAGFEIYDLWPFLFWRLKVVPF